MGGGARARRRRRPGRLFAILFLWQLPHFLAIGWIYREDYARGGFPMLTVSDATGARRAADDALHRGAHSR